MARSRRLGIAGEVSVWQIPENGVCTSPCQHDTGFFFAQDFCWRLFLLEKRSMIDFPIRRYVGPMTFPGWDGADWVLSTQRSRIRGDWILSTQRLPIHWSLRDSLGDDIVFFIPDANKISSSFSCRFFLS